MTLSILKLETKLDHRLSSHLVPRGLYRVNQRIKYFLLLPTKPYSSNPVLSIIEVCLGRVNYGYTSNSTFYLAYRWGRRFLIEQKLGTKKPI